MRIAARLSEVLAFAHKHGLDSGSYPGPPVLPEGTEFQ